MKLVLIRHGESIDDEEDRFGGLCNLGLTAQGKQQAKDAANQLRSLDIQRIFSSPLRRANECATIIQQKLALPNTSIEVVHELHERNSYGILSGHKKTDVERLFGGFLKPDSNTKSGYAEPVPGSEPLDQFNARVARCWKQITDISRSTAIEPIVLVSHRNFYNALAAQLALINFSSMSHGEVRIFDI